MLLTFALLVLLVPAVLLLLLLLLLPLLLLDEVDEEEQGEEEEAGLCLDADDCDCFATVDFPLGCDFELPIIVAFSINLPSDKDFAFDNGLDPARVTATASTSRVSSYSSSSFFTCLFGFFADAEDKDVVERLVDAVENECERKNSSAGLRTR